MNHILNVKLPFRKETIPPSKVRRNLRKHSETSVEKIDLLIENLNAILRYYDDTSKIIKNFLIDVNYNDIIAKSKRIKDILKPNRKDINDMIVGARFSDAPYGEENHIITYYIDKTSILQTINNLMIVKKFLIDKLSGKATSENFNEPENNLDYSNYQLSKSKIRSLIVDCSVVDSFSVPRITNIPDKEYLLITFYKTNLLI